MRPVVVAPAKARLHRRVCFAARGHPAREAAERVASGLEDQIDRARKSRLGRSLGSSLTLGLWAPGLRRGDQEKSKPSYIRQHPVTAVIGIEPPAALPADGGTAGGGGGILRHAKRAAQAVRAAADVAGGEGCTGSGDADEEQKCCNDLDGQSHGRGPPEMLKLSVPHYTPV